MTKAHKLFAPSLISDIHYILLHNSKQFLFLSIMFILRIVCLVTSFIIKWPFQCQTVLCLNYLRNQTSDPVFVAIRISTSDHKYYYITKKKD